MLAIVLLLATADPGFVLSSAPAGFVVTKQYEPEKHPLDFKPVTVKVVPAAKPVQKPRAASSCANGQCGTMERRGLFGRRR